MRTLLLFFLFLSQSLSAEIYLSVTGAGVRRAKLGIGEVKPLGSSSPSEGLAAKIRTLLQSDLEFMNLFEFIPESASSSIDKESLEEMDYTKWSNIGTSFVIRLGFRSTSDRLTLEASFYDIPGQKRIFSQTYQSQPDNLVRLVHELSESILKALTGEQGLFKSRILMVCHDLNRKRSPAKDVFIVNADGSNLLRLTDDKTLSTSPSWMNDGTHITYTQFEFLISRGLRKRGAVLKKHNLSSGARSVLYFKDGMNSGATWSPNGNRGFATMSFKP